MAKKTRKEELLDELLKEYGDSPDIYTSDGPLKALQKRFYEQALESELRR